MSGHASHIGLDGGGMGGGGGGKSRPTGNKLELRGVGWGGWGWFTTGVYIVHCTASGEVILRGRKFFTFGTNDVCSFS